MQSKPRYFILTYFRTIIVFLQNLSYFLDTTFTSALPCLDRYIPPISHTVTL